jgi:hypothetical protein
VQADISPALQSLKGHMMRHHIACVTGTALRFTVWGSKICTRDWRLTIPLFADVGNKPLTIMAINTVLLFQTFSIISYPLST